MASARSFPWEKASPVFRRVPSQRVEMPLKMGSLGCGAGFLRWALVFVLGHCVRDVEGLRAVLREAGDRRLSNTTKVAEQREVEASSRALDNAIDDPVASSH